MIKKRILALFLSLLTLISCYFVPAVSAAEVEMIPVAGRKTVVDTMTYKGVTLKAYYSPYFSGYDSDMTSLGSKYGGYCCAGFIYQFHKRVYGITVMNLFAERNAYGSGEGSNFKKSSFDGLYYNIPTASKGYFYRVKEPKVGDVVVSNNHWAIAKKVSTSGTITLIEQNYWYGSYSSARINRKISKNNGNYWFFRYSGSDTAGIIGDKAKQKATKSEIWKVCSDDGLNVRTGAGKKYKIKTFIPEGTIIHVTDKVVAEGILWGKCEFGWCAIEYCDYVKGSAEKDSFVVSFVSEYGSGNMGKIILPLKVKSKLPKNKFKYGSKKFLGWNVFREADNKWLYTNGKKQKWYQEKNQPFGYEKVALEDKANAENIASKNNEKITLYARFKKVKITDEDVGYEIDKSVVFKSSGAKPSVKVFLGGKYLKKNRDYSLSYSNNKAVGMGKVKIKLKGDYKGAHIWEFKVVPKSISSFKAEKRAKNYITLSWKGNKNAKGYMLQRLDPKTGKYVKVKTITKNKTVSFKDSGLSRKTKYKYRIKAYCKVDGKYYYSEYKYLSVKTK